MGRVDAGGSRAWTVRGAMHTDAARAGAGDDCDGAAACGRAYPCHPYGPELGSGSLGRCIAISACSCCRERGSIWMQCRELVYSLVALPRSGWRLGTVAHNQHPLDYSFCVRSRAIVDLLECPFTTQSGRPDYQEGVSAFTLGNTNKIASLLGEIGRSAVKAGTLILLYDFCTGVISIDHERAQCRTINCTIGLKVRDS